MTLNAQFICYVLTRNLIYFIYTLGQTSSVRLVGGSSDREGRVEILYNGNWGTVCDDRWGIEDANVVCQMLGYGDATSAPGRAFFGQGDGDIILDEMSCTGTESDISECSHNGYLNHDCRHREDAGVVCSGGGTGKNNIYFQYQY